MCSAWLCGFFPVVFWGASVSVRDAGTLSVEVENNPMNMKLSNEGNTLVAIVGFELEGEPDHRRFLDSRGR